MPEPGCTMPFPPTNLLKAAEARRGKKSHFCIDSDWENVLDSQRLTVEEIFLQAVQEDPAGQPPRPAQKMTVPIATVLPLTNRSNSSLPARRRADLVCWRTMRSSKSSA